MLGIEALESGDAHVVFVFPIGPEILDLLAVDAARLIGHPNGVLHGIRPVDACKCKRTRERMDGTDGDVLLRQGLPLVETNPSDGQKNNSDKDANLFHDRSPF